MDEDLKKNILKTGTSLVGIVTKEGVIMAGDKRSTLGGQIVSHKDRVKVVPINDYLVVSGTGVASDIEMFKKLIRSELKLKELRDKKRPTIKEAANLIGMIAYKNIRQPSMVPFMAGLMVGGLDEDESAKLYSIEPAGTPWQIHDYDANLSSGMPYILGLLEKNYKKDLTMKEGVDLAIQAIQAAIERDPASGNGVDVYTLSKEGIKHVTTQIGKWDYQEEK